MPKDEPGALVVNLAPARRVADALAELQDAWRDLPAPIREKMSRLAWLHPNGEVVYYRPPEED